MHNQETITAIITKDTERKRRDVTRIEKKIQETFKSCQLIRFGISNNRHRYSERFGARSRSNRALLKQKQPYEGSDKKPRKTKREREPSKRFQDHCEKSPPSFKSVWTQRTVEVSPRNEYQSDRIEFQSNVLSGKRVVVRTRRKQKMRGTGEHEKFRRERERKACVSYFHRPDPK